MMTVNKYQQILLEEFYLDVDDVTVRRAKDGWRNKYMAHDVVTPFKLCSYGYGGVHVPKTRTTVPYHQLITLLRGIEIPEGSVIDHLNGNPDDNSRENIRVTTQALNTRNRKKHRNNTSGSTGISWNSGADCYIVRRYVKGTRMYGGSAQTLEEAKLLLDNLEKLSYEDGYTTRHGK
jgi:hypothetical protein